MINLRLNNAVFDELVRANERIVQYNGDAPLFGAIPKGWILHVAEMDGSPFDVFNVNNPGSRRFSHLWVAKNGRVERFGNLYREAWAQVDGNSDYWSVETEGFHTEPLTNPQLWALARIHRVLELAANEDYSHVVNSPGDVGVGTHEMGGAAWGGHACPGALRAAQRPGIIHRAHMMRFQRRA